MDDTVIVGGITAIGTFLATIWGKGGWNFLLKKQEIEGEISCREKIRKLEQEIAEERIRTSQVITGVDMMLTMFEDEFGDNSKYASVITKVRDFIKVKTKED